MGFVEFFGFFWILTGIFAKHKLLGMFFIILGLTVLILAYKYRKKRKEVIVIKKKSKKTQSKR